MFKAIAGQRHLMPVVVAFVTPQRRFFKGMTAGAVKSSNRGYQRVVGFAPEPTSCSFTAVKRSRSCHGSEEGYFNTKLITQTGV
jgi:hypothetical protein